MESPSLVKDERDVALGARRADLEQPALKLVDGGGARAAVGGRQLVRSRVLPAEAVDRVDDDGRDLPLPQLQELQGVVALILEDQAVRCEAVVAGSLHDAIPPTVVGTLEDRRHPALSVEAGLVDGAHHGLCAAHVEGDLLLLEDLEQHLDVFGNDWVHRTEARAHRRGQLLPLHKELLRLREAEDVHSVRTRGVEEALAGGIYDVHAFGVVDDGDGVQGFVHDLLPNRVHALEARRLEAKIGKVALQVLLQLPGLRPTLLPRLLHPLEGVFPLLRHLFGRLVRAEELVTRQVAGDDKLRDEPPEDRSQHRRLQGLEQQEAVPAGVRNAGDLQAEGNRRRARPEEPRAETHRGQGLEAALHEDGHDGRGPPRRAHAS
mmetsp:Transcript_67080/g.187651  ORF Transcript_67080/g.187651 Transcript_67080/m.187651 type:complete len:377 (-) Transcript_67080:51-1181(-)